MSRCAISTIASRGVAKCTAVYTPAYLLNEAGRSYSHQHNARVCIAAIVEALGMVAEAGPVCPEYDAWAADWLADNGTARLSCDCDAAGRAALLCPGPKCDGGNPPGSDIRPAVLAGIWHEAARVVALAASCLATGAVFCAAGHIEHFHRLLRDLPTV